MFIDLVFPAVLSLVSPNSDGPSSEGMDADFRKIMLCDLVENRVVPGRLRIEQCGLSSELVAHGPS